MMNPKLTRRHFLGGTVAAGASTLLPAAAQEAAATAKSHSAGGGSDIAIADLTHASVAKVKWKAEPFSMTEVRVLPSFWKNMMELDRSYLYSLPNDRLAYNFRVNAGIATDADPLGGWEAPDCELRGHYVGHYLSASALLHASTGDVPIKAKADDLVAILAGCQAKDGYLSAFPVTFFGKLRNHEQIWAPFYTFHKILAGMIDMYEHTGNQQALQVAIGMGNWADNYSRPIPEDEWQRMLLVEQGGMNEAAFNLYAITGNVRYKDLAYRFEHKKIFDPLAANQDMLAGNHANTNIPKVIGAIRGYELTGDQRYLTISRNFYRFVTERHAYCTGGTSNGEFWHKPDAIASQLGPAAEECCCSYNMLKLSRHLFGQEVNARYFDYYERVLFNVRNGTQDHNGMLMYYVSLKPGLYKTFGTQFNSFWCCTGTGSEEYVKLNDSIYFHDADSVYVNLFIPSSLDWKERGLQLSQTTKFPDEERTVLTVVAAPSQATALKVRIPYWATKGVTAAINGQPVAVEATPSTYVALHHDWKAGDVITIDLPMPLHLDQAPDDKQVQAAMYGPLVLAVRQGTEGLTNRMIYGDNGPWRSDDGYPMPTVKLADAENKTGDDAIWFERIEGSREYPLQFRSKGRGPIHTLAPLNRIFDERYSVYVRNEGVA
ncbi:MAG: glycoside hydrolase family 127 protein [Acidobacteriota bacterium]